MENKTSLYLVPTPIGNMEDITLRALRILKEADFVLAEDTRKTGFLLKHYDISQKMKSYHAHNEHQSIEYLVSELKKGLTAALVTDAGTPGISDPGFLVVRECLANGLKVECLPGATAFVPALVKSGLPSDSFVFDGFLPHKKGRQTKINSFLTEQRTVILYESPHRLLKTLGQFVEILGTERPVSVSRELTKIYEETFNGTAAEALAYFSAKAGNVKGEIVIVLGGCKPLGKEDKYKKYAEEGEEEEPDEA